MQANPENLSKLSSTFAQTFSPDPNIRKSGETTLHQQSSQQGFVILLLFLISSSQIDISIRQAASIYFKNIITKQWPLPNSSVLPEQDRITIRDNIINLMLSCPELIKNQLAAAIAVMSELDFPDKWNNLLVDLSQKLQQQMQDNLYDGVFGILNTLYAILGNYVEMEKTDELEGKIALIVKQVGHVLLHCFTFLRTLLFTPQQSQLIHLKSMNFALKLFYTLNYHELPEFFEDNMSLFFDCMLQLLSQTMLQQYKTEEEELIMIEIKALVCDNINLFMEKYEEEFDKYAAPFATSVWNLMSNTVSKDIKYDILISRAIMYLTTIAKSVKHDLFKDQNALLSLTSTIIEPNILLREEDVEQFEDDPIEYMRRDIEGSDSDTRRRSAMELVRGLMKHYEQVVSDLILQRANHYAMEYVNSQGKAWKKKDAQIYLMSAITAKSTVAARGVVEVNPRVNVLEFLEKQVIQELISQQQQQQHVILQADCIKCLTTFRAQLPKSYFAQIIPLMIQYLHHSNRVVHSYAANFIEKIVTIKEYTTVVNNEGQFRYGKEDLKPFLEPLCKGLFVALRGVMDNEYVMKCLMRCLSVGREDMTPLLSQLVPFLQTYLLQICEKSVNAQCNHYLFESFATLIRNHGSAVHAFENALFPSFQHILQNDIQEFQPYVFQLMSLLVSKYKQQQQPLPLTYYQLLPGFLQQNLWENVGNIPGLVGFIVSVLSGSNHEMIHSQIQIKSLLLIIQNYLIFSKKLDSEGVTLLQAIVLYCPKETVYHNLEIILQFCLTRLQKSKTNKFIKLLFKLMSLFVIKWNGAKDLIQCLEKLQPNLFLNLLQSVWIPNLKLFKAKQEKKLVGMALIRIAIASNTTPLMIQLLNEIVYTIVETPSISVSKLNETTLQFDDENGILGADEDENAAGYQVQFSRLSFAKQAQEDVTASYPELKIDLVQQLKESNLLKQLAMPLQQTNPKLMEKLVEYFAQANMGNPFLL